jgi:hypothetical protein
MVKTPGNLGGFINPHFGPSSEKSRATDILEPCPCTAQYTLITMAAMVAETGNVRLISQDQESFVVSKEVANMSSLVTSMMMDDLDEDEEVCAVPFNIPCPTMPYN